jgi:hypothetical protein
MIRTSTIVLAAAIVISTLAAPAARAMTLGSLSRQHLSAKTDEIVTNSIPSDRAIPRSVQPKFQLIFLEIGSFLRQHAEFALAQGSAATIQLVTFAAR